MAELKYYLTRRIITFIPTLIGLTLITFIVSMKVPSDPAHLWAGGIKANEQVVEMIKRKYHLDAPIYVQYYYYLLNLLKGDLGISPITHRPILKDLLTYFPATAELAIAAEILIIIIGVPLGIISALKRDSIVDHIVRVISLTGVSLPAFWLGLLLQWIFYYKLSWLPAGGRGIPPKEIVTGLYILDSLLCHDWSAFINNLKHIIMPAFTLAYLGIGVVARITRSSILDIITSDFVVFLQLKGLKKLKVMQHILKNALIPIITILGLQFGGLLGGAVITETIFYWPGIGRYAVQAIYNIDFPAIMGVTLLMGLVYVTINFFVDIMYAIIDPRVRL